MTPKRKFIQLIGYPGMQGHGDMLYGLCDDGSVWAFGPQGWLRFPDAPEGEGIAAVIPGEPGSVSPL